MDIDNEANATINQLRAGGNAEDFGTEVRAMLREEFLKHDRDVAVAKRTMGHFGQALRQYEEVVEKYKLVKEENECRKLMLQKIGEVLRHRV